MNGWKNRCSPGDSRSQSATSTRLPLAARIQRHVCERHRPPGSALERVERHDLADATASPHQSHQAFRSPYGSCAAVAASGPSARPRRGRPDDPGTGARLLRCRKYCRSASATSTGTIETNSFSDLTPRAARRDHSVGSAVGPGEYIEDLSRQPPSGFVVRRYDDKRQHPPGQADCNVSQRGLSGFARE